MANYPLVALNPALPKLRAPSASDSGTITNLIYSGVVTSTIATGTAPFSIASTTVVPNLNVSKLLGATWAIPGSIGSTTPNAGAFTTLAASGAVTLSGGTANGILFLDGSKVLTSGSGLQFDGSNLGLGVTPGVWSGAFRGIQMYGGTLATQTNVPTIHLTGNALGSTSDWLYLADEAASRYTQTSGSHQWYTAPSGTAGAAITFTEKARIDSDGLKFNGDTAAANALDDYEEGTWTPSVGGDATYTAQTARYTKIGRFVNVSGRLIINVIGTGSTTTISGLPFVNGQGVYNDSGSVTFYSNSAISVTALTVGVNASAATLTFFGNTAASSSSGNNIAVMGNSFGVDFQASYSI